MSDEHCEYCGTPFPCEDGFGHSSARCREYVFTAKESYRKERDELRAALDVATKRLGESQLLCEEACAEVERLNGVLADAHPMLARTHRAEVNAERLRKVLRRLAEDLDGIGLYNVCKYIYAALAEGKP